MKSALTLALLLTWTAGANAGSFTVTNTNASGAGSLADAVAQANLTTGPHTIGFNIPGTGPFVIPTTSALSISQQMTIDATTQPGFAGTPIVVMDGSAHTSSGFSIATFSAGGSVFRGFVMSGYDGITFYVQDAMNVVIEGNYLGVDPTGTTDVAGSGYGVMVMGAISTRIGGSTAAQRNVIGGFGGGAIYIQGACNGLVIEGNYLGTNAAGTAAIANAFGVRWLNSNGVTLKNNLISGNNTGVAMYSGAGGNILGNWIGLNAAGTAAIPNQVGISVSTPNVYVGGPSGTAAERNVISGNTNIGIWGEGDAAGLRIYNNFIGTNPAGTAAIPNALGVFLNTGANAGYIGGGAGLGNVISGNTGGGVTIARVTGTFVYRNLIGTAADGVTALGNGSVGIDVYDATGITIGSSGGGSGNTIAFNTGYGVRMMQNAGAEMLGNSFHSNTLAAIGGDSMLAASATVTSAANEGTTTRVTGTVQGLADHMYSVETFSSPSCDPSGSGEGVAPYPPYPVMTDGSGAATFLIILPTGVPVGHVITATVVDLTAHNTSVFSTCTSVCPSLDFGPASLPNASAGLPYSQALTGTGGTAPYAITLVGGSLPSGITLASNLLSGTAPSVGGTSATFRVTDVSACASDVVRSLSVSCPDIEIFPMTLPDAVDGTPYSVFVAATGGAGPYEYYLQGAIGWVAMDMATGELSGDPDPGTVSFNVLAIDSTGCSATQAVSILTPGDLVDAGVPDATPGPDADPGEQGDTGCDCSSSSAPTAGWPLLLVLVLLRRRRSCGSLHRNYPDG